VYLRGSSPAFYGCTFQANDAIAGGGVFCDNSSPSLEGCTFTGNTASTLAGGLYVLLGNVPVNTSFFEVNTVSAGDGGGIAVAVGQTITATNCVFSGNQASGNGDGMYSTGSTTIDFCAFQNNTATSGSAFASLGVSPSVSNSIIWGNSGVNALSITGGIAAISQSIIQGGSAGCLSCPNSNGNIDPLFHNAADFDGVDNVLGTSDDGLKPICASPAVEAGAGGSVDITGINRFGSPDLGAYEQPGFSSTPTLTITTGSDTICAGASGNYGAAAINAGTNPVYQWKINGIDVAGEIASTYLASSLNNADVVGVSVTADNDACAVPRTVNSSNDITVFLLTAATILADPASDTVCVGSATSLSVSASGIMYQWEVNDGANGWMAILASPPYSGENTSTLSIATAPASATGFAYQYRRRRLAAFYLLARRRSRCDNRHPPSRYCGNGHCRHK